MTSLRSYRLVMLALVVALVITSIIALCIGRYSINPLDAFGAILSRMQGSTDNAAMENVIFVLRIPRILGAIIIGACLSLSGAVYQSVFKNPLVSPDILGVSRFCLARRFSAGNCAHLLLAWFQCFWLRRSQSC